RHAQHRGLRGRPAPVHTVSARAGRQSLSGPARADARRAGDLDGRLRAARPRSAPALRPRARSCASGRDGAGRRPDLPGHVVAPRRGARGVQRAGELLVERGPRLRRQPAGHAAARAAGAARPTREREGGLAGGVRLLRFRRPRDPASAPARAHPRRARTARRGTRPTLACAGHQEAPAVSGPQPTRVVIAGGGTAGWITAVALARQLGRLVQVTLVESEEIGTIGVGESTIPTARAFHELLKIDQQAFMRASQASFKLGISFENWARPGDRYLHTFGSSPLRTWVAEFQHFWLEANARGEAEPIGAYYPEHEAAREHRFMLEGELPLNYAYHLDAGLYARFLRQIAETDGATRREGKIAEVELDGETGNVAALLMEDGGRVEGDLFVDCTGFRALLIERT